MRIQTLNQSMMASLVYEIVALDEECFKLDPYFAASPWSVENYVFELESKWDLSQVALSDQEVSGVLISSRFSNTYCHVHRFFVSPKHRRQKVASKMQRNLEALASSIGIQRITLFVHEANRKAISFYENLGYERCIGPQFDSVATMKSRTVEPEDVFYDEQNMANYIYMKTLDHVVKEAFTL